MLKLLFSSRWLALLWVGGTMASVASFVTKDGAVDQIGATAQKVSTQRRELADAAAKPTMSQTFLEPADPDPEKMEPGLPPGFERDYSGAVDGEVYINYDTGQRLKVVRRSQAGQPDAR